MPGNQVSAAEPNEKLWRTADELCACGHVLDRHDLGDDGPEPCDLCGCPDCRRSTPDGGER